MKRAFQPWEFLIVAVAGWISRGQQGVIDCRRGRATLPEKLC
ncbi:hypothetical protein ACFLQ0_00555 [Nitrospinota bacterium]